MYRKTLQLVIELLTVSYRNFKDNSTTLPTDEENILPKLLITDKVIRGNGYVNS